MQKMLAIGCAFLLLAFAMDTAHSRVGSSNNAVDQEPFVPRPEVAKTAALGFDASMADYYWLQAVQVVGGSDNPALHGKLIGRLIDVATTLDPWMNHPYRFAALWMNGDLESVLAANKLLERAIEYHPDDWRMYLYLSFNHFFYLGDHQTAAEVLAPVSEIAETPTYLRRLLARLRASSDGLDVAAGFLKTLIENTEDGFARADYEKALDEIETEARARFLEQARKEFQRRHARDIRRVEELVEGNNPVLQELPKELHDFEWELAEDGRIVSSYYGYRYEPQLPAFDRKRQASWRAEREALRE